jgi:hypothetical protein
MDTALPALAKRHMCTSEGVERSRRARATMSSVAPGVSGRQGHGTLSQWFCDVKEERSLGAFAWAGTAVRHGPLVCTRCSLNLMGLPVLDACL